MTSIYSYIPIDRYHALAQQQELSDRTWGAALFADISGFTTLTQNLDNLFGAKRGAEILTQQLDKVYGALIEKLHQYHGSVIGFSGDAITCWFDQDNGLLAVACALAMQQVMQVFSTIEISPQIQTSLSIKVAIASGKVRRFVVGQPNIQYIEVLAGETLGRMAQGEKLAEKGQIVVTDEICQALMGQLNIFADKGEFTIIQGLTSQVIPQPWPNLPTLAETTTRPWVLTPVYERLDDPFLAEIRPAVALFLNFTGLNYDLDEIAPTKLNGYIQEVQRIVTKNGGFLIQLTIGDKGSYLYATFGPLVAQGNDTLQALSAAMALRELSQQTPFIQTVQIGLSQGKMYAGMYGSPKRKTFGVLGPEVNLTARLMSKAESGQILVSQTIFDKAYTHYEFNDKQERDLKNIDYPVITWSLVKPRSLRHSKVADCVGRESELQQLHELANLAQQGQGQIVWLEGEAGIGKSHLMAWFGQQLEMQGWRVVRGACHPMPVSYTLWQTVFVALLGEEITLDKITPILADLLPDRVMYAPLLGDLLNQSWLNNETTQNLSPQVRQGALRALVIAMIRAWASQQPLALILEDTHWLDDLSRELLQGLFYELADSPLLILMGQRIVEQAFSVKLDYAHRFQLTELPQADLAHFIQQHMGKADPLVLEVITHRTRNPFFMLELWRNLVETERLYQADDYQWQLSAQFFDTLRQANCLTKNLETGAWQLSSPIPVDELPETIDSLMKPSFDRLSVPCSTMLKIASVMGNEFEHGWLNEVDSEIVAWLPEAEKRGFIQAINESIYQFKHHLTREAIYNAFLPESQLKPLHQQVAEALERFNPQAIELLAYHFEHGGVRSKWLAYGEQSADKARRNYANEVAKNYYHHLLEVEERAVWRKTYTEVLHIIGDMPDEERASLEKLGQHSEIHLGEMAFLWGKYYEQQDEYSQAEEYFQQAQQYYQNNNLKQVECLERQGFVLWKQDNYDEAKEFYQQALRLFKKGDDEVLLAHVFNSLGSVYRDTNDLLKAQQYYEQALNMSDEALVKSRTLNNLGLLYWEQSDYDKAKNYYKDSLYLRRKIGSYKGEAECLANLAILYHFEGEYQQEIEYLNKALNLQTFTKIKREKVNLLMDMGILYHDLGAFTEAEDYLRQALQIINELGGAGKLYALENLGLILSSQFKLTEAQQLLEQGLSLAQQNEDEHQVAYFYSYLGLVYLALGQFTQAIEVAKSARDLRQAEKLAATFDLATMAEIYLHLDKVTIALDYAQEISLILQSHKELPSECPQRNYWVCYQVFMAAGQEADAQPWLQKGYDLVQSRAAKISDITLKQTYLENVAINRAIIQAYNTNLLPESANKLSQGSLLLP